MRVLVIDPAGNGLDFAMRAQKDGHEVKHFIRQTEKTRHIGRGLVPLVDDYKKYLRWANLIFNTDNTYYVRDLDSFRGRSEGGDASGVCVVGATEQSAEWELNRGTGQEVFKKHGIKTPDFKVFNDYDKAIAYVKKEDRRFVSKPSGDADKALSYCSKTPEDMVYMLERWKKLGKLKSPFLLQEFIAGTEMAVGGWFGPGGWNSGWCENFEFKKLMNNDLGVATGEQGTVLRYVRQSKLARKMLLPLTDALFAANHTGYVDVNCIIDDSGHPWPLEFTMRPGWPTFNIQQAVHLGDCVQWLHDLAKGIDGRPIIYDRVAVGVVMSIPDYPYSHLTRKEVVGIPVYGIKGNLWHHIHPCEMQLGTVPVKLDGTIVSAPNPVTAGDYVLVMTASGETVKDTANTVYRRLERLLVPNSPMYRTDIGRRLAYQLPSIQKTGYATGLTYSQGS